MTSHRDFSDFLRLEDTLLQVLIGRLLVDLLGCYAPGLAEQVPVVQLGVRPARAHAVHADSLRSPVPRKRLREADETVLRGGVAHACTCVI